MAVFFSFYICVFFRFFFHDRMILRIIFLSALKCTIFSCSYAFGVLYVCGFVLFYVPGASLSLTS